MKQPVLIGGVVIAVILVFGVAFSVGQVVSMSSLVDDFERRIAQLETRGGATTSSGDPLALKIGVVRVNDIGTRLQQIPEVADQLVESLRAAQQQAAELQQRFESGQISESEYTAEFQRINTEGQAISAEVLAIPIQTAVNQIGIEEGYDVIAKVEDVVLFAQNNVLTDVTEEVWARIERNRR